MHDPSTVAHEIKYPWRKYRKSEVVAGPMSEFMRDYHESFITIWHEDPEIGGSDDSCGWFTPPFSKELRDICKTLAGDEAREPWFFRLAAKSNDNMHDVESLVRGVFILMSRCMVNRGIIRRQVSLAKIERWASEMTHGSIESYRSTLCFLSGYHSNTYSGNSDAGHMNSVEDDKFWREEQARSFFGSIAAFIMRDRRWWFQKPRWHVWHWRFQVHPWQQIRRYLLSRCSKCGGMFKYGESPCSDAWNAPKLKFLRGETHVYHSDCSNPGAGQQMAAAKQESANSK